MRRAFNLLAVFVFLGAFAAVASAQDFQKSYNVSAGGRVSIANISGDVKVTGYSGNAVIVHGYLEGRDVDKVEFDDRSSGNSVDVRAKYPKNCRCDVSIRFEVQVPTSTKLIFDDIASISGDVWVSDVSGVVSAKSISGDVHVMNISGSVDAHSTSGDVEVEISRLEGDGDLMFGSVSGNVRVRVPSYVGADVSMTTVSGDVSTSFPLEVKRSKYGPGASARGQVGDGARHLSLKSVSGDVRLEQM